MENKLTGKITTDSWGPVPPPFNPLFDPKAKARYEAVSDSMEKDGFHSMHTREECKKEWRKRYDNLKKGGQ